MITIVGAGMSGLALGHALADEGQAFQILEASPLPGGVIRTLHRDGHRMELGPQRLRAVPAVTPFLDTIPCYRHEAGTLQVQVARHGRLHPLPTSLLQAAETSAISFKGKLRGALEPLACLLPDREGQSAAQLLRRRLGDEIYRAFAGPLLGGLYGSDPEEMEASRTLIPAMETMGMGSFIFRFLPRIQLKARSQTGGSSLLDAPIVLPIDGMEALPRSMAADLFRRNPGRIALNCPVHRIERLGGGGIRLETEEGILESQSVVLTTPPRITAQLLDTIAPDAAQRLRALRVNDLALVHLQVSSLPPSLGFQVALGEPQRIRGATFSGALDGTGDTAVVYLGGMLDPELVALPDHEVMEIATREFTTLTGLPSRPLHLHRTRMPAWDRSWEALDGLTLPEGIHLLTNYTGRPGIVGRISQAGALARTHFGSGPDLPQATLRGQTP